MDPWSFGSEGKGLLFSDETDNPFDAFARSRKALMEWEMKPSYSFENDGLVVSGEEAAESVEFMEFGFADMMGKHFHGNPSVVTPNSSFGEVESGWKLSGSVMECNSHDSSLIDLKLGRLGGCKNADISKERSLLSSDSVVAKRARTSSTSSYSQPPFCQVQGCNMNLSSSKYYHKKHKVCDAHSKTSRVIVNGIEQRFCQQCSRFHLLAEFDDGKRSCRKRLAGHNERRRKPQLDSFSGKSHKFLQSIQGARFMGAIVNGPFLAKSLPRLHSIGKQQCPVIPLDTPSNDQEISGSSNSSCALSLLSTQSHDLPSGTPNGGALIFPRWRADHAGESFYSSAPDPIHNDHSRHGVHGNKIFQGSGFSNPKQRLCPQQGTTVDLLQLSSHLQRVEQQRSSEQIKQENEDFFGFLTT